MNQLKITFLLIASVLLFSCAPQVQEKSDPLPSWNEGKTKQAIVDFVHDVTNQTSTNYVKPADRIATFDNDGTLWSEQPLYFQLQFVFDRVKELAEDHPEWEEKPLIKAVLENDINKVLSFGERGAMELVMATSTGMTTDEFSQLVKEWIMAAKNPATQKLYKDMVFQPMLELLDFLRASGFKTYIVSGGGAEFMRPWSEEIYGIPSEQVIGSTIEVKFEMTESGPVLKRLPEIDFFNDKEGKPAAINKFIGKKPIFAAGNSDGDLQMLQWTDANTNPSFQLFVHHTDVEREWAYDRDSHIGRLDKGLDESIEKAWTVIDMRNDWKVIYPFELE
jgi:phosphoserine phosphatase